MQLMGIEYLMVVRPMLGDAWMVIGRRRASPELMITGVVKDEQANAVEKHGQSHKSCSGAKHGQCVDEARTVFCKNK